MTVSWPWQPGGQVQLVNGMLVFPPVPDVAGVYRLTFSDEDGQRTAVCIGQSQTLRGRFQHYRTPGANRRQTTGRLNQVMVETLEAGGRIAVEVVTQAQVAAGDGPLMPLDLSWEAGRTLVERAAEVNERTAGSPVLNK